MIFDTSSERELISKSGVDVVGSELDVEVTFISVTFLGVELSVKFLACSVVLTISPNRSGSVSKYCVRSKIDKIDVI